MNGKEAIWYAQAIDNAGLRQGRNEAKAIWSQMEGDASAAGMSVQKIWSMVGVAGAGIAAKQLIGQMVQVRGEMQMLEKSFDVLLQSEEKSAKMLSEIRALATESPLEMTHVSQAAQTLLGFGVDAEKVMGIVRQLSDVSMGNSDRFQRLSLVYAQTQAAGKLMGQDLLQMINAGFNPLQIISEQTGKSIATLKEEMSTGAISAQMVADAFAAVTSEGGKFYQMTQKQASGIVGLKASFDDAITMMFNELGEANEGVIADAIKGATYLVENYEKVGKILLEIAATYGVYKAALIAVNFAQAQKLVFDKLVAEQMIIESALRKGATADMIREAATTKALAIAKQGLVANLKTLAKSLVPNPYVLAAAAVAALAFGIYKLITYQTDAEKAQSRLNKAMGEADAASAREISSLARLKGELSAATKGTDEYNKIKDKIVSGYGKYRDGLAEEIEKVGLLDSTYQSLTKSIQASFGARQYEQFMKSEVDNLDKVMSENLTKIQDRLIKKLGDEKGAAAYYKILSGVIDGSITATLAGIKGLDDETAKLLDNVAGFEGGVFDVTNRRVEGLVLEIQKAQKLTDEIDKKARERFGITGDTDVSDASATTNTITTAITIDEDTANRLEKQYKDLDDLRTKLASDSAQAEIDTMDDGFAKRMAQLQRNHELEEAEIEANYAELARLQGGELTSEQDGQKSLVLGFVDDKFRSDAKAERDAVLSDMMTFTQKYQKIITDTNAKIKDAQMAGASLDMFGALSNQENEAINRLSEEYAAKSADYEAFMRSVADASIEEIQAHINNAEALISQIIEGGIGEEEVEKYLGYVARLNALKDQLKNDKPDTSPGKESERDWKKLYSTLQKVEREFGEIGESVGGTAEEAIKTAGTIASSMLSSISAITQLANWSITATEMAAQGASKAIIAVEKASVILAVIGAVMKAVTAITGLFKDNEEQLRKAADAARGYEQALREIDVNRRLGIHENVFGTDGIGRFTTAVEIAAESLKTINDVAAGLDLSSFFDQLKSGEIGVFDFIERANGIEATFDGRSKWNKLVGSGNHKIKNYAFDVNEFINTDGSLKLEELQDWLNRYGEGLEEWEKEIVEDLISAGNEYVKAQEAQTAYLNELWGDLAGSIADNMIEAFLETGDAAANLGDLVDDVAKNMAKSMIVDELMSGIFNDDLQNKLSNLLKSGNQTGANNLIKNAIDSAGQLAPYFESIMESVGLVAGVAEDAANEARTSASQGFAQASQDSIDKIDGILTNIQNHTYGIFELMKSSVPGGGGSSIAFANIEAPVVNIAEMMRANRQIQQANTDNILGRLTNIDMNTRPIAEMQKDIHYMRGRTDDMADSLDKFTRG